jgi:hypothetical protein
LYGDTPSEGFSCIGFVSFVFRQLGVYVPGGIDQAWNSAPHVAANDLMPGDILFFSNTFFPGLSHVAIYIGNGQMIGADNFAVGVTIDDINNPYWSARYTGATRPLAMLATVAHVAPVPAVQPQPAPTITRPITPLRVGSMILPASSTVSLYTGPGYQYGALKTLNPDRFLSIVQEDGSWYKVRSGATSGWVSATNVRVAPGTTVRRAIADAGVTSPIQNVMSAHAQGEMASFATKVGRLVTRTRGWVQVDLHTRGISRASAAYLLTGA